LKCLQNLLGSYQQRTANDQQEHQQYQTKLLMNKLLCQSGMKNFRNLDEFHDELSRLGSNVKLNLDKVETLEDSTYSILFYNYAVYLYANKQYSKCFKIIDKLYYQFNELLDAALLRQINLIFIELLVQKRQVNVLFL
jgi:hypothetical protein